MLGSLLSVLAVSRKKGGLGQAGCRRNDSKVRSTAFVHPVVTDLQR